MISYEYIVYNPNNPNNPNNPDDSGDVSYEPFPEPVPLRAMIDILNVVWDDEL